MQANFNPEVGFVRRADMSQYTGEVAWEPQLRRSRQIQNLNFGATVDYYETATGRSKPGSQEATARHPVREQRHRSTSPSTQTFDRLVEPFAIRSDVAIPAGDYQLPGATRRASTSATAARSPAAAT